MCTRARLHVWMCDRSRGVYYGCCCTISIFGWMYQPRYAISRNLKWIKTLLVVQYSILNFNKVKRIIGNYLYWILLHKYTLNANTYETSDFLKRFILFMPPSTVITLLFVIVCCCPYALFELFPLFTLFRSFCSIDFVKAFFSHLGAILMV